MIPEKKSFEWYLRKEKQRELREKRELNPLSQFHADIHEAIQKEKRKINTELQEIKKGQNIETRKIYLKLEIHKARAKLEVLQEAWSEMNAG